MYIVMKKEQHIIGYDVSQKRGFAEEKKNNKNLHGTNRVRETYNVFDLSTVFYIILVVLSFFKRRYVSVFPSFLETDKESHF